MIKTQLIKQFPHIRVSQAESLAEIWEKVVNLIFEEVERISSPEITEFHIDLEAEVILEHAKLRVYIVNKVIEAHTEQIDPNDINLIEENQRCFS